MPQRKELSCKMRIFLMHIKELSPYFILMPACAICSYVHHQTIFILTLNQYFVSTSVGRFEVYLHRHLKKNDFAANI